MDPHRNRIIALLENGCDDREVLQESFSSCVRLFSELEVDETEAEKMGTAVVVPASPEAPEAVPESRALEFASERTKNMTPLEMAVLTQNTVAVELLLANGAQVDNSSGLACSALCKVCYNFPWNVAMVKTLLEHGANPDATTNNDTNSASCLIISVMKDNIEAVKLLLEFGADVSYEWKGANALSMAIDFNKDEIIEMLEKHEFRRAQDNRWKRFTDRKKIEETRVQQQRALKVQRQLEAGRREMLQHTADDSRKVRKSPERPSRDTSEEPPSRHHQQTPLVAPAEQAPSNGTVDVVAVDELVSPEPGANGAGSSPPPPNQALVEAQPQQLTAAESSGAVVQAGVSIDMVQSMTSMDWIVSPQELTITRAISGGAHGEVFEGLLVNSDERVAVKKFPCHDEKSRQCFKQECMLLSKFRHENIVMFKGAVIAPELCCVLSELCSENLLDRIHRDPPPTWMERLRIACDIAKSMIYLHTRSPPIVHRDLKSMNVLLDHRGSVKLCDFGMARTREHTYIATQHIAGSPAWMAPEVLRGDDFDDRSDVYAFGVILWELMTLKMPWPDKNMAQLVGLVGFAGTRLELPATNPAEREAAALAATNSVAKAKSKPMELPEGCPIAYVSLIRSCWEAPADRPPFRAIKSVLDTMIGGVLD